MSSPTTISHPDLLSLVEERQREVRAFLNWANRTQVAGYSMRMLDRPDIRDAASAVEHYQNQWWGHVVFSCFGSLKSAIAVAPHFQDPPAPEVASELLAGVVFSHPKVGHHRIQPGLAGAKKALVSACGKADLFRRVLHSDLDFDSRTAEMWAHRPAWWGRTTIFDLLLRAGALAVGGRQVLPDRAYLAGSTGPAVGFAKVFGVGVTDNNGEWAEAVLRAWSQHWGEIVALVGAEWEGSPYTPGDFENALCIWQEPGRT